MKMLNDDTETRKVITAIKKLLVFNLIPITIN